MTLLAIDDRVYSHPRHGSLLREIYCSEGDRIYRLFPMYDSDVFDNSFVVITDSGKVVVYIDKQDLLHHMPESQHKPLACSLYVKKSTHYCSVANCYGIYHYELRGSEINTVFCSYESILSSDVPVMLDYIVYLSSTYTILFLDNGEKVYISGKIVDVEHILTQKYEPRMSPNKTFSLGKLRYTLQGDVVKCFIYRDLILYLSKDRTLRLIKQDIDNRTKLNEVVIEDVDDFHGSIFIKNGLLYSMSRYDSSTTTCEIPQGRIVFPISHSDQLDEILHSAKFVKSARK